MTAILCLTAFLLWLIPFDAGAKERRQVSWEDSPAAALPDDSLLFVRPATYDCVRDSAYGHLIHPADSSSGMNHFFSHLDDAILHKGSVSILHLGDSHIQAGHITQRMRTNFARLQANGGRGLLFPFRAMNTNPPRGYTTQATGYWTHATCLRPAAGIPLGLAGAAITTSGSGCTVTFDLGADTPWPFDCLHVMGEASNQRVLPVIICDGDTLLCDTHTDGIYTFLLNGLHTHFTLAFSGLANGRFTLRGVLPQNSAMGITYSESGINGASAASWLACERLTDELSLFAPDLAIIALGTNDSYTSKEKFNVEEFMANYRRLVDHIREVNPRCSLVFVVCGDNRLRQGVRRRGRRPSYAYNTNIATVEQALMTLAREYDAAVFNTYALMGGSGSSAAWVRQGLMRTDYVHFSETGYELQADLLYNALMHDYQTYRHGTTR